MSKGNRVRENRRVRQSKALFEQVEFEKSILNKNKEGSRRFNNKYNIRPKGNNRKAIKKVLITRKDGSTFVRYIKMMGRFFRKVVRPNIYQPLISSRQE